MEQEEKSIKLNITIFDFLKIEAVYKIAKLKHTLKTLLLCKNTKILGVINERNLDKNYDSFFGKF